MVWATLLPGVIPRSGDCGLSFTGVLGLALTRRDTLFALVLELLRDIKLDQNPNAKCVMVGGMNPWTVARLASGTTRNLP